MDLAAIKDIYDKTARILEDIGFLAQLESDAILQKIKLDAVGTAKPTRGLCLGLGRLRKNSGQAQVSCVQLCAFQRIMRVFELSGKKIVVHDPGFNKTDDDFINTFGYDLVTDPALSLRALACEEPTVVYHPYLPRRVLEQIFVQNWTPELLKNLILFGNELSDWLSDPILRFGWTRQTFEHSQTPCLDKCLLLLDVTSQSLFGTEEMRNLSIDKDKDWRVEELVPIVASQVSKWRFEWIPAYRVYAMGEKFWHIRPIEASRWKELRNKEKCGEEDRSVESAAT